MVAAGPKGTGLLYVRKDMLDVIQALEVGAYSDKSHDLQTGELTFVPTAQRYEWHGEHDAVWRARRRD
jgi:selenocysteine lyase/cysteine desulfurase